MAESPAASLTSDIRNVDLIPDTAPFGPITADQHGVKIQPFPSSQSASPPEAAPEEITAAKAHEEAELGNSIERELFQLTIMQAEIEAGRRRLDAVDDVQEEGKDVNAVKRESIDEYKKENDGESVEDNEADDEEEKDMNMVRVRRLDEEKNVEQVEVVQGENEDERKVEGEAATKSGRRNHSNNGRRMNYPMRADAEDCAYYVKFGTCKFGLNCKFNHPPRGKFQGAKEKAKQVEENSEKDGQTECKYYLTSGGCRYGKDCKYSHGSNRSFTSHDPKFNFIGLPIRPGEKECPYYMRNGSCKYGSNCRFHHPNPTEVAGGGSHSGHENARSLPPHIISSSSISSWSSPRAFTDTSPFVPVMHLPTQHTPALTPEWNGYQAAAYQTSETGLPIPPAFAMNNLSSENNFPMQNQYDMLVEEYPERPGEPECSFFLKTGDCKFKSNCKFHHPKNRSSKAKANSFALNDKGLPLRPDKSICAHYHRYGICKYGPACKYDHPSKFAISPPSFDQPPFSNSKFVDEAEQSAQGSETKYQE